MSSDQPSLEIVESQPRLQFSEAQEAAIACSEPRYTIHAAAGSGKTAVLVERYLREILVHGRSPDQVLAITFSRKAAAEMKGRIVRALREADRTLEAQQAESGPIQTIHSFCERILRENVLAAGLDPEFEILSGAEPSRRLTHALQTALVSPFVISDEVRNLLLDQSGENDFRRSTLIHARLKDQVQHLVETLRSSTAGPDTLAPRYASPEATLVTWTRVLMQANDWEAPLPSDPMEAYLHLEEHLRAKSSTQRSKPKLSDPTEVFMSARLTSGLMSLAIGVWQELEASMMADQAFDFTLLERLAVDLLRRSTDARDRTRQQFRVLLIDEAQDLNPVQYELIEYLGLDRDMMVGDPQQAIYGFRHSDRRLFIHRTQQYPSLHLTTNYRTVPGILAFIDELFREKWQAEYVAMEPHRSPPASLTMASPELSPEDEEDPFGRIATDPFAGVEWWEGKGRLAEEVVGDGVAQLLTEGVPLSDIAVLVRNFVDSQKVYDQLTGRQIPVRIVGGAERFFTRLEIFDLANAIEALVDPYRDYALLATLRSPVAGLSLDSIALLATEKPLFPALVRTQLPIEEDQDRLEVFLDWFVPLSRYADRLPAWEIIAAILNKSPYMESVARLKNGTQMIANVRKLLAIAAADPRMNPDGFAESMREVQRLEHREGEAPAVDHQEAAVTVLNVHKSKGLEFPVVVLANLHSRLQHPNRKGMEVDAPRGIVAVSSESKLKTRIVEELAKAREARERQEEDRLLYVAMTRARDRLCLVQGKGPEQNIPTHYRQLDDLGFGLTANKQKHRVKVRSLSMPFARPQVQSDS